jgi:hypothetical protein
VGERCQGKPRPGAEGDVRQRVVILVGSTLVDLTQDESRSPDMKRSLFSIAGMMALVVLIALGFGALRNPTLLWASLIFTATVAFLAMAILGTLARRGRARMTWAGVAVFGWLYLALSFGPMSNANGVTYPPFLTQVLVDFWQSVREASDKALLAQNPSWRLIRENSRPTGETILNGPPNAIWIQASSSPTSLPSLPPPPVPFFDWQNLRRIGHSLGAVLFGLLGGLIGRVLARRDEPAEGGGMSS